jgi:iron complex outermembrane receptor protein
VGDNLIVYNAPTADCKMPAGISNKGIELGADAFLSDNLTMQITYSYTHMKQPVYATPEQQLFISARYRHGRFLFSGSLQHVHNLDTEVSSAVAFQSYTLANAKVSYQLCKYAQLFVSAENLLGQHYETNRYYPSRDNCFWRD